MVDNFDWPEEEEEEEGEEVVTVVEGGVAPALVSKLLARLPPCCCLLFLLRTGCQFSATAERGGVGEEGVVGVVSPSTLAKVLPAAAELASSFGNSSVVLTAVEPSLPVCFWLFTISIRIEGAGMVKL